MDVKEREKQAARIERLLQEVAAFPDPQMRAKTEELLRELLEVYGAALTRVLEMTALAEVAGQRLVETLARDELVGALLLLHGLYPVDLETRIRQVVGRMRAYGTPIEFVQLKDGIAYLRLTEGCHTCSSLPGAFKQALEAAISSAIPDLDEVRIEDAPALRRPGIPVKFVPPRKRKGYAPLENSRENGEEHARARLCN